MRLAAIMALAGAAWIGSAAAGPGDFRLEVGSSRPDGSEDTALQGYALLQPGATHSRAVGTVGRAFSVSPLPDNTVWGVVTEAINFPTAIGSVVGTESAVVNMAPGNTGELRGLDIVFKNRMDSSIDEPVPAVGENRFNESSAAVFVSSQPRSPAGEYSGWQAGIRFARFSLDRSSAHAWTAALDVSDVQVEAPFYLVVWRCGALRCGLRLTPDGPVTVADIDRVP
jgi:hypothetical protein